MDVAAWLEKLGLGAYAAAFADNDVDGDTLRQLTAEDLRELGVASIGHRRRLIEAIAALNAPAAPAAAPPPATAPAPAPAAPALDAQRRPVTVLFADLCGFTAMSRELSDESVHALLDRYLAAADEIVVRHGGTVDKHIGDAVMALFGAPVAHDDDPMRAVRAAIELRDRMPALSLELGRALEVHAGIAGGEVIVGGSGGGYTAIGDTVNLAARLTSLAPAGGVLVSGATRDALAGGVVLEAMGRQEIKGYAEPVDAWRVVDLAAPGAGAPMTPFVGRAAQVAQIAALLDGAAADGAGALVYVRGEPGIGKSRLVGEARRMAGERGVATHACHVLDFGAGLERDPLRRLADSLLGLAPDAAPEARVAAVEAAAADAAADTRQRAFLSELADAPLTPDLRAVIDASDEASRRAGRHDAIVLLVRRALARGPALVVVEDVHWADEALVEALLRLAGVADDAALIVLLASRPENERLLEALRLRPAGAPLVALDLGPLRAQDAAAIVGHVSRLPEATVRACVERAGGNPLFLEQLLRNATEASGELPPSLRGIVVARVDRLRPADRAAIHAAAVLGQRFDREALRALLGDPAYDAAALLGAGLLRVDGVDLMFAHALIREGVLRSLLAEPRRALHLRAGGWFDGRDPLMRASHLDHAGSPDAADAYRQAAEDRLRRYRPSEALPLVDRGLELAGDGPARAALLTLKGDTLLDGGRAREALAAYQEALGAGGDPRGRGLALLGSASARRILDQLPAAFEDVAAAQALAEEGGWLDIQTRCRFTRGNLLFPLGRVDECLAEHQAALELAERAGDAEARARALGGLGDAEYARGNIARCARHFGACVEESRRIGLGRVEVSNRPMFAFTTFYALRLEEALAAALESVALAISVGQKRAELISRHMCVFALLELGRAEESRPHIERARAIVGELEAWRFEPENLAFLADIEIDAGRPEAARPHLVEGLRIARDTTMSYWGPAALSQNALLEADPAARAALVDEAETLLAGKVLAHNHVVARRNLIELARGLGDPDMVEDQCAKLAAFYSEEPMPMADFLVRRGRVLAAAMRGALSPEMAAEARALLDLSARTGAVRLRAGLEDVARAAGA